MKNVLILFGGNSFEHEVSCSSVNFIIDNIDTNLFNYKLVGIDYNNEWYEVKNSVLIDINWKNNIVKKIDNINKYLKEFDIVFPMIHGNTLEDGKLQSLFEMNNTKYVGCNSYSSLISYDKLLTKLILEKYDVPQVPYVIYNKNLDFKTLKYPVIVKPCKCGSSIGISIVNKKNKMKKAIKQAQKYDSKIIIEKYIKNNRELECAVLEKNNKLIISDVGEIINNGKWYDYDSKYKTKNDTIISNIDNKIKKDLQNYTKKIFEILECKNISRVDFLYDLNDNKLYFNEINTMPGFTDISMYPKLIINSGINPSELLTILLK
jgi:D-alanine--D-alanine ligase